MRGIDRSIGLYINPLPVVITWHDHYTVREQLHLFATQWANLNDYSFVPLANLQKKGSRLFHTLYIADYDTPAAVVEETSSFLPYKSRGTIETLDYILVLVVHATEDGLQLQLKFDETLLDPAKATQLLQQLSLLLADIPPNLNAPHHKLSVLTAREYQQMMYDWNDTAYPYSTQTIAALFTAQVSKTPHAIALSFNQQQLTYQELNAAANQLAHYLQEHTKNSAADTLISLFFSPSL